MKFATVDVNFARALLFCVYSNQSSQNMYRVKFREIP